MIPLRWDAEKRAKSLKFLALVLFMLSAFIVISALSSEKMESKNNLYFISGPYESYSNKYYGRSAYFRVKLKNYRNEFSLNVDYLKVFSIDKFKSLLPDEKLAIGIFPSQVKYLNSASHNILFFSAESSRDNYLTIADSARQYKYHYLLGLGFGVAIFISSIICLLSYFKLRKLFA